MLDFVALIAELQLKLGEPIPPIEFSFFLSKAVPADKVLVMEATHNNFRVIAGTMLSEDLILAAISEYIQHRNEAKYKLSIETEWKSLLDDKWHTGIDE